MKRGSFRIKDIEVDVYWKGNIHKYIFITDKGSIELSKAKGEAVIKFLELVGRRCNNATT